MTHFFGQEPELPIDWEATEDFYPEDTDSAKDYEQNEFLDLSKPLLRQVWESNFRCSRYFCTLLFTDVQCSKSYYLKQVHQPRHLSEPARLFGSDFLEVIQTSSPAA